MATPSQNIEHFPYDVTREWLHHKRIVIFTLSKSVSREAIDVWMQMTVETINNWPENRIYLVVHDFSQTGFSRYLAQKAEYISKTSPSTTFGRIAAVIPRSPIGHIIRLYARVVLRILGSRFEMGVFFERESALSWLEEKL